MACGATTRRDTLEENQRDQGYRRTSGHQTLVKTSRSIDDGCYLQGTHLPFYAVACIGSTPGVTSYEAYASLMCPTSPLRDQTNVRVSPHRKSYTTYPPAHRIDVSLVVQRIKTTASIELKAFRRSSRSCALGQVDGRTPCRKSSKL